MISTRYDFPIVINFVKIYNQDSRCVQEAVASESPGQIMPQNDIFSALAIFSTSNFDHPDFSFATDYPKEYETIEKFAKFLKAEEPDCTTACNLECLLADKCTPTGQCELIEDFYRETQVHNHISEIFI